MISSLRRSIRSRSIRVFSLSCGKEGWRLAPYSVLEAYFRYVDVVEPCTQMDTFLFVDSALVGEQKWGGGERSK